MRFYDVIVTFVFKYKPQTIAAANSFDHIDAKFAHPIVIVIFTQFPKNSDSTGIALILNLLVKAGRARRKIYAYGLSDHYKEIFRITRLADFIRIYQDEASLLASV